MYLQIQRSSRNSHNISISDNKPNKSEYAKFEITFGENVK